MAEGEEKKLDEATFAGGCFWCVQHDFDHVPGVISTQVGYTGGDVPNPSYEEVSSGRTGHYEATRVVFDPEIISYAQLLDRFWHMTDPENSQGQFCDVGSQYRPAIFYRNEMQKKIAEESRAKIAAAKVTDAMYVDILPLKTFYSAEAYHQKYYKKSPFRYNLYQAGSGRDKRLHQIWDR
jgi:methionine-S-sulfoxide reductase